MTGYIHSLQSMGTLDGPGVRAVVFMQGCPLRCVYCHNPDTWNMNEGQAISTEELTEKILRFYPYIKKGGVTFSGGEPCLQAEFIREVALSLKEKGLHIALDTSGEVYNERVGALLEITDLVLLDIKMTTEDSYRKNTGGSLEKTMAFLRRLQQMNKEVWIRHVVVPSLTDSADNILRLRELISGFSCVKKTELLPFRTLCKEKYESMGIEFPLKDTPETDRETIERLYECLFLNAKCKT